MSAATLKLVESPTSSATKAEPGKVPGAKAAKNATAKSETVKAKPPKKTKAATPAAKKAAPAPKAQKREAQALDVMTSPALHCSVRSTLNDAARLMWENNLGAIVVVDDEMYPVGMITDRDISMAAYTQGVPLYHALITSAMSKSVTVAKTTTSVDELREMMAEARVRRVPVVDETNRLCGMVGLSDILAEALAPVPKERKRGTSAAMLVQLMDAVSRSAGAE